MMLESLLGFVKKEDWFVSVEINQPFSLFDTEFFVDPISLLSPERSIPFIPSKPVVDGRNSLAVDRSQISLRNAKEIVAVKGMIHGVNAGMLTPDVMDDGICHFHGFRRKDDDLFGNLANCFL